MTVSMRKMSPGTGYRYLLRSVAAGDGNRALSTQLTRYYAEAGTPPGVWLGSGLPHLGDGRLRVGAQVQESQLALLMGMGRDPVTGDRLGRAFPEYRGVEARVAARVAELPDELCGEDRDAEVSRIEAEEGVASARRPVAGFDFTFSVPKSVSVLWGVADADLQAMIVEAHHAAVGEVLDFFEREVAATRTGISNENGAVAQVDVLGVIAAAFDHYDSRAGDPQLHTHVVISNKVKTEHDGRWRSLDSRPVHAAVTAISAHYNAVLADRLTGTIGVGWEARGRGADRNVQWEVAGVSEALIREFSSRTREIEKEKDRLIAEYVALHGREPSGPTIVKLRAQATLATRPEKEVRSLADLTGEWRRRAGQILSGDATVWARAVASASDPQVIDPASVTIERIRVVAGQVVDQVSTTRSTWRHWNLWAEASKQTMGWRFGSVQQREGVVALIVAAAENESIALTPPELATSPVTFQREDGTSVFRPRHSTVYSSVEVMVAEDRLLARSETMTAPWVTDADASTVTARLVVRGRLSEEQADAVRRIAVSRRRLDLLVGPAGAGKTTTMLALRRAWEHTHGRGSVVGLAPSASAAKTLAGDLGIECENTAKWLHEHQRGNTAVHRGQLVIVDEATLADTRTLDRLTGLAELAGAKALLVGDDAQLSSVDAGGAFAMLVNAGNDVPRLTEIHRFTNDWEKAASLALREGDSDIVDAYNRRGRVREGTTDQMLDQAYAAWRQDVSRGLDTILVTESSRAVHALNARARAERLLVREDDSGREAALAGGARASAGDLIITRKNARDIRSLRGEWVRNGDRWHVLDVGRDGALIARRAGRRIGGTVVLPPEYVAEHVDLGYAVTAHRAQGITVDTAHTVVNSSTTRENLYVSMTRGRDSNIAYVALDQPDEVHETEMPEDATARTVLHGVLRHTGGELSAHQTAAAEHERWGSIAQLAAEYETIAAEAQHERFVDLLRSSGLPEERVAQVVHSTALGPLVASLRRTEAYHHDLGVLVPRIVAQHRLDDAEDIAAVLQYRLDKVAGSSSRGCRERPDLVAGLIPEALGAMPEEHRRALDERKVLIARRALALAEAAVDDKLAWTRRLGEVAVRSPRRGEWLDAVAVIAAYRDRYGITSDRLLGGAPETDVQRAERLRAAEALRRAQRLAEGRGADHRAAAHEALTIK